MARFDWYQATVQRDLADVRDVLATLGDAPVQFEPLQRAPHGYAGGFRVLVDGATAGQIWAGGTHAHPHVVFSGEDAHTGAQLLREHFPGEHFPSRLDACEDYPEPGAYDVLQAQCLGVAKDRRIKIDTRGDHLVSMQGRTLYLGSTKSVTRVRLYDKAAELRAKLQRDPVRLLQVPEHLARLEVQVRPQTHQARAIAATADPVQMFGSAAWTLELMRQVAGLALEPCNMGKAWRASDDDRAYAAMLAQYGGLLGRLGAMQGWDCLGLQIRDDLAEREQAKLKRHGAPR